MAAPQRVTPVRSSSQETATSSSEIDEARAANSASRKNAPPMMSPNGICARPIGRFTNSRLNPEFGSLPTAKTSENTTKAATSATAVSASATMADERGTSASVLR